MTDKTTETQENADTLKPVDTTQPPVEQQEQQEQQQTEDTVKAVDDTVPPLDTTVWGDHGEVGNSVLNLMATSGLDPQAAKALLFDAVQGGDVTKIDKAALEKAVGKDKAALILVGAKAYIAEAEAKNADVLTTITAVTGSKENWEKMRDWSKDNLSEDEIADYAEMLNAGGAKARFAVADMKAKYEAKNTSLTDGTVIPKATGQQIDPDKQPLSRKDYYAAMEKLQRTGGNEAARQALWARRKAGMSKNI